MVQAVEMKEGETATVPIDQRNRFKKINFVAQDQSVDRLTIPFKAEGTTAAGTSLARCCLFEDLVSDEGKLEIWLQCMANGSSTMESLRLTSTFVKRTHTFPGRTS